MKLTTEQQHWLYALQRPWPLEHNPLAILAERLGTTEASLLDFITELRAAGRVRRIGGVFDARRLGYRSCLFGVRTESPEALQAAAARVCALPGVTHAYTRGWPEGVEIEGVTAADYVGYPDLWYTLSAPANRFEALAASLADLKPQPFPALTRYKIDVVFDLRTRNRDERTEYLSPDTTATPAEVSEAQAEIVRRYQDDTDTPAAPFREEDLPQLRAWQADGTLRRFALLLYHRANGFMANGMCCWAVPAIEVDTYGRRLAAMPEVTHCYARPTSENFPFTIYAMIHNTSWEAAYEVYQRLSRDAELTAFPSKIFFSTHEYKKSSLRFFL
jgi:DNA-binding Lrp family transcriptional regulator